jgi:thiol-disulfide isomerase/thioredoxin
MQPQTSFPGPGEFRWDQKQKKVFWSSCTKSNKIFGTWAVFVRLSFVRLRFCSAPRDCSKRCDQGCQMVYVCIFKPKIPIWVNFGGPWIGKCRYIIRPFWNILREFGIFYDHLVHFAFIFPVLVSHTKRNLATLGVTVDSFRRQRQTFDYILRRSANCTFVGVRVGYLHGTPRQIVLRSNLRRMISAQAWWSIALGEPVFNFWPDRARVFGYARGPDPKSKPDFTT